jgi:hypothetical protein
MANQNWVSVLNPDVPFASGAGASLTLAASTQICSPVTTVTGQDVAVINGPGQYLGWKPGLLIRTTARGFFTSTVTSGTLLFLLRANKNNANATYVTLATTGTVTTPGVILTGIQWKLEALSRVVSVTGAASGIVNTQGEVDIMNNVTAPTLNVATSAGAAGAPVRLPMPNISGETATSTLDMTQANGWQLAITSSAASGTLQCTQWLVEVLN